MSSWFDYDEEPYTNTRGLYDETWADTVLVLGPNTMLWAFLSREDLTQDYVKFTTEDIMNARYRFINCGYPLVYTTFSKDKLVQWLFDMYPYILTNLEDDIVGWKVDLNKLADVNDLSDEELVFLHFNENLSRDFLIFCNLSVDMHGLCSHIKLNCVHPPYFYFEKTPMVDSQVIKEKVKSWNHVPNRYYDE